MQMLVIFSKDVCCHHPIFLSTPASFCIQSREQDREAVRPCSNRGFSSQKEEAVPEKLHNSQLEKLFSAL